MLFLLGGPPGGLQLPAVDILPGPTSPVGGLMVSSGQPADAVAVEGWPEASPMSWLHHTIRASGKALQVRSHAARREWPAPAGGELCDEASIGHSN